MEVFWFVVVLLVGVFWFVVVLSVESVLAERAVVRAVRFAMAVKKNPALFSLVSMPTGPFHQQNLHHLR